MNKDLVTILLAATVLAAAGSIVLAEQSSSRAPQGAPSGAAMATSPLTPDQQRKIAVLRTTMQQKLAPVRPQLKAVQAELVRLWAAEKPDRAAILAAQKRLLRLVQQHIAVEDDFRLAVLPVLSATQRGEFLGRGMGGKGAGIGSMVGGKLSGGIAGAKGGGGSSGGLLSGALGSLFGGDGGDEDDGDDSAPYLL
jgi:Spy/CpxP family protein refolding chaperone